jgi:hypothetical protein
MPPSAAATNLRRRGRPVACANVPAPAWAGGALEATALGVGLRWRGGSHSRAPVVLGRRGGPIHVAGGVVEATALGVGLRRRGGPFLCANGFASAWAGGVLEATAFAASLPDMADMGWGRYRSNRAWHRSAPTRGATVMCASGSVPAWAGGRSISNRALRRSAPARGFLHVRQWFCSGVGRARLEATALGLGLRWRGRPVVGAIGSAPAWAHQPHGAPSVITVERGTDYVLADSQCSRACGLRSFVRTLTRRSIRHRLFVYPRGSREVLGVVVHACSHKLR